MIIDNIPSVQIKAIIQMLIALQDKIDMYWYFDGMIMIMGYNWWLLFFLLHFSIFYSIVLLCVAIKRQTTRKQVVCILGFWSEKTIFHVKKCEFTIELRRVHFLWWTPKFFRFCDFSNWTGTGSIINAYLKTFENSPTCLLALFLLLIIQATHKQSNLWSQVAEFCPKVKKNRAKAK